MVKPDDSAQKQELAEQKQLQGQAQEKLEKQQLSLLRARFSGGAIPNAWDGSSSNSGVLG